MRKKKEATGAWWVQEVLTPSEFEKNSLQLIARMRFVQRVGSSSEPEEQRELETA